MDTLLLAILPGYLDMSIALANKLKIKVFTELECWQFFSWLPLNTPLIFIRRDGHRHRLYRSITLERLFVYVATNSRVWHNVPCLPAHDPMRFISLELGVPVPVCTFEQKSKFTRQQFFCLSIVTIVTSFEIDTVLWAQIVAHAQIQIPLSNRHFGISGMEAARDTH